MQAEPSLFPTPDITPGQPMASLSIWLRAQAIIRFLVRYPYLLFKFIQAVVSVTSVVSVALLALLLGFLIFTRSDQFTDLLVAMIYDWQAVHFGHGSATLFLRDGTFVFALFVWALTLSFSSRWVLLRANVKPIMLRSRFKSYQPSFNSVQVFLLRYVPRLLSTVPFLIVEWSFIQVDLVATADQAESCRTTWCLLIVLAGLSVLLLLRFIHRRLANEGTGPTRRLSTFGTASVKLDESHNPAEFPLFQTWVRLLFFLNGFLALLFLLSSTFATLVGFGSIFIFALAIWGQAGTWLHYQSARRSFSFVGLLIAGAIIISLLRINIQRRSILLTGSPVPARTTDVDYVDGWLTHRIADTPTGVVPVIIVAAEGGGSRSAHWTAGVLTHLDSKIPNFRQHVLAISGVSGGSVGSGFYFAWHRDHPNLPASQVQLDSITSGDFLSSLVGAFCYPDPAMALLWPFSARFDRARWLENRFSEQYKDYAGTSTLDSGLVSLFNQNRQSYSLPLLLLNTTVVETGKKAILSPVILSDSTFYEAQDVLSDVSEDIPLKTAMGLSARFPVVTPAGTVYGRKPDMSYRLVDGGYFENTGLHTAYQLLQLLNKRIRRLSKTQNPHHKKIVPVVMLIKNGDGRDPGILRASSGFAPVSAFYNAWDHRTPTTVGDMNYFVTNTRQQQKFIQFVLPRSNSIVFPLGWYLSQTAEDAMDSEVDQIEIDQHAKTGPQWLNFQAYHTLADSLKLNPKHPGLPVRRTTPVAGSLRAKVYGIAAPFPKAVRSGTGRLSGRG